MKKIIVSLSVLLAFSNLGLSQDINFSQFYEAPLLRNPALAGIFEGDVRVKANLRSQWASITVPYKTQALSAEYKLPLNNASSDWLTLGMQVTNDVAGSIKLRKTGLMPVLSFNKSLSQVNNSYLSIAFMGGPVSTQFNPTELLTHDDKELDKTLLNSSGYTYWDMGAGITYSSDFGEDIRYFLGAAMYHINNPKLNYFADNTESSIMGRKLCINSGISAQTSDNNKVQGFVDYLKQDGNEQFLGGLLYGVELSRRYNDGKALGVNFGTFFRWNDALIPTINFDIYDWNVGLSYDVNISKLNAFTRSQGGVELSLSYRAKLNRRTAMGASVRCPTF
jgi:type IX secretion system PorP/SprF family membrane protein